MTKDQAEEYTQALGQVVAGGWRQIALGEALGVPKTLGLTTPQWVEKRLGGYVKLSVQERRTAAQELKAEGKSGRAIGRVLGVDHATVLKDLGEKSPLNKTASKNQEEPRGDHSALDTITALAATPEIREHIHTKNTREAKEAEREARRAANRHKVDALGDPLATGATFATIVIDPPWDWSDEGDADQLGRARPTYHTMTFEEIRAYPVSQFADVDCHCYLWITNRSLPKGSSLLQAWGFRYVTCLTWCTPSIGMGNYFRGSTEQILFGVKGSQPLKRHDVGTWFRTSRDGGHSTKPDAFYVLVESCSPGPYLNLFGRGERPGWHTWGE